MEKISKIDFKFLRNLSSLYQALTTSAVDPVVITDRVETGNRGRNLEFRMYYDAYGDGGNADLEMAEEIMRRRIRIAGEDIKQHHIYHSEFLRLFYDIDERINSQNRKEIAQLSQDLFCKTKDYIDNVVESHTQMLQEDSFLYPPYCLSQYAFHIPKCRIIANLIFNPKQTISNAKEDLDITMKLSERFAQKDNKIPINKVATQEDLGEGIMDASLRGRVELNKELLERLGFYI